MFQTPRSLFVLLALAFLLPSCRKHTPVSRVPAPPPLPHIGDTQTGVASWYGDPYHGRTASNGEVYDMEQLTAAHRTLPFETMVRVTNLANNRTVDVRITDRGPFVDGRIIDLSRAAARQLEMIGPGTTEVRIQVTKLPPPVPAGYFYAVQVGAFRERRNAEILQQQVDHLLNGARIIEKPTSDGDTVLYRVLLGHEPSGERAETLAARLRAGGFSALVVRIENEPK